MIDSTHRHGETVIESLVDHGPATSVELCERLNWTRVRLSVAIRYARENLCPNLGLTIPNPTPTTGWRYEVTTEWEPVEHGASYALGMVESRLRGIHRDVVTVKPHLERGSVPWRRADFLEKHLGHITTTLEEINGSG